MTTKIIASGANQTDIDICNAVQVPTPGCSGGAGRHIVIPGDFLARIAIGQNVPGCTYSKLEEDGSLFVNDRVQLQISIPAIVQTLTPGQQTEVPLFVTKINSAVIVAVAQNTETQS